MSSAIKWILVLIVLVGGGWLVWYSGWLNSYLAPKTAVVTTPIVTPTPTPTPTQTPVNMNGMSDAKDAGDGALVQDLTAIDTQMQGLTADGVSLDTTINDKALPQAY